MRTGPRRRPPDAAPAAIVSVVQAARPAKSGTKSGTPGGLPHRHRQLANSPRSSPRLPPHFQRKSLVARRLKQSWKKSHPPRQRFFQLSLKNRRSPTSAASSRLHGTNVYRASARRPSPGPPTRHARQLEPERERTTDIDKKLARRGEGGLETASQKPRGINRIQRVSFHFGLRWQAFLDAGPWQARPATLRCSTMPRGVPTGRPSIARGVSPW